METQKLRVRADQDGTIKIKLPQSIANQELDIVVVFQTAEIVEQPHHSSKDLGYSRRFLEEVMGSWEGEPLERPKQLPLREVEDVRWHLSRRARKTSFLV